MRFNKNVIQWLDPKPALYPHFIGFCPTERAWNDYCRQASVKSTYPPNEGTFASCEEFNCRTAGVHYSASVITLSPLVDKKFGFEIVPVLTHELRHAMQRLWQSIGEATIGREAEAYYEGYLMKNLLVAYEQTRRPLFRTITKS